MSAHCGGSYHATEHRGAYRADLLSEVFGVVDHVDDLIAYVDFLGVDAVFGEVFDVDFAECAQSAVDCDETAVHTFDFKAFH